jgi:hypothetical protein
MWRRYTKYYYQEASIPWVKKGRAGTPQTRTIEESFPHELAEVGGLTTSPLRVRSTGLAVWKDDTVALHYAGDVSLYLFTMGSSARMQAAAWAILECESSLVSSAQTRLASLRRNRSQVWLSAVSNRDCRFHFIPF